MTGFLRPFVNALDDLNRPGPEAYSLLRHADNVDRLYSEHRADVARWDAEDREREIRGDVR